MQTVPALFDELAEGDVQPNSWGLRMSFDKGYDDSITFFTLDASVLNGTDILGTSTDNPIQAWDYYSYANFTDRVTSMSWSRELDFPFSTVSAMADFELNNYDDYFTPGSTSPIASNILPKRPVRMLSGFSDMVIPQFVGLTQGMPEVRDSTKTASFHALDFLTQIYDTPIKKTIAMRDVRTDEVLAQIFSDFGLAPEQYDLARARNKIPFLFFEHGQITAGEVIRKLIQAEMGLLWLGEDGIVRFVPRLEQPTEPSFALDESNVVDVQLSSEAQIKNKLVINAEIREVQPAQIIYQKSESTGELFVIAANSSRVFEAQLEDPLISATPPTLGEASGVSWFTAAKSDGTAVASDVSVSADEIRTNNYEITFDNDNAFPIEIRSMDIWGEPAKVVDHVEYTAIDQDSIDKYEEQILQIDNNFIQSVSQCESLALTVLDQYKEYAGILEVSVKGNPARQLGDILTLDARQYDGEYQVIGMMNKLVSGLYSQNIKVRRYTPRTWFQLDVSVLDGTHVLAP